MTSPQRIGIMGGTFDPIHNGHLVAASEAAHRFALDTVVFVPTGQPWQKSHRDVTAAEHRYLMTMVATASNPRFTVSRVDIDREGPTYTIDTLRDLRIGQRATVTADMYGDDIVYHGRVVGLGAGSGNAFALLPEPERRRHEALRAAVAEREAAGEPRRQAVLDVARAAGLSKRVVYDAVHRDAVHLDAVHRDAVTRDDVDRDDAVHRDGAGREGER